MGFGKAFGFSLLAYMGLNFLFIIIANTINGALNSLFSEITADYFMLIILLCGPVFLYPGAVIESIYTGIMGTLVPDVLILAVGAFVSPFIAAIVAGRVGEKKGASFGGWFLTAILSAVAVGLLLFLSPSTLVNYGLSSDIAIFLPVLLIGGAVMGIFYGAFALMFTKTEYY